MEIENLHAHIDSTSSDCDGQMDRSYVMLPNDDETASEFGEIEFEQRVIGSMVSTSGFGGRLEVRTNDEEVRLEWNERTDEGYRHVAALFCNDESCNTDDHSQRDHRAESAGY